MGDVAYATDEDRILKNIKINLETGCWEWTRTIRAKGYGGIWFMGRTWRAHRLSWHLFRGPIPDGLWVLHKCDNPPCCNPDHLYIGTNQDNVNDGIERGQRDACKCEAHGMSKITQRDVDSMRADYLGGGYSHRTIAERYGISESQAGRIMIGKAWADSFTHDHAPKGDGDA